MARLRLPDTPEDRFEALYAEHYGHVLGYVLRRAPAAVAADVVADVFLVAWRRLEQVPDEPLPWLLGVARRTLANERRSGRRRAALVHALEERRVGSCDGGEVERLAAAFERIGENDRELLLLIAWEGLTAREAGVVLGVSHAACRVRLHRARRRLARELAGTTPAGADRVDRLDLREEI